MILLLGGSGVLGTALQEKLNPQEITLVSRENVMKWMCQDDGPYHIKVFIEGLSIKPSLIINAAGMTNPLALESELLAINYQLPINLIRAGKRYGARIVTFGSIMEEIVNSSKSNKYLESKQLFKYFLTSGDTKASNFLHLQIHTWYGGINLGEHMFLGQLLRSIKETSPFEMSEGKQLREYHHIHDDMKAVSELISQNSFGIHQINHGEPYSLKVIAEHLLGAFSLKQLLRLGTLPTPIDDNFNFHFARTENLQHIQFRPTLSGLLEDFQERLEWSV
jgi:nucleoside-diphosphate-sugar epimerase